MISFFEYIGSVVFIILTTTVLIDNSMLKFSFMYVFLGISFVWTVIGFANYLHRVFMMWWRKQYDKTSVTPFSSNPHYQ